MEEPNMGMDPQMKKYFTRIANSFSVGFFWLFAVIIAGLRFRLALIEGQIACYNIVFYAFFLLSFFLLLRFYYRLWK